MTGERRPALSARSAYLRLWRVWLALHWPRLLVALALMLVFAATSAAMVRLTVWLVDALDRGDRDALALAPLAILGATLLRATSLYFQRVTLNRVLATAEAGMQKAMHRALIEADLSRMQDEPPAALAARFTADIGLVRFVLDRLATSGVLIATIVGAFTQLLVIDWVLTFGVMGIFLLAIWPITRIGARLQRITRTTQEQVAAMTAQVNEGFAGARLAKAYRLEEHLQALAAAAFDRLRALKVRAMDWHARVEPIMEALGGIAIAAIVALVGFRIAGGHTSIGDFSGFLAGLAIASQPVRRLGGIFPVLSQGLAALERIYALLDAPNRVVDAPGARPLPPVRGEVRFEGVSFRYPDGTVALDGIDLTIAAGTTVALVGQSGAGKSSLFNLIPRLYDPGAGRVRIDGHDLRDVTLASLRDQIALVSQDSVLLSDSVAANIGFGRPGATRGQIEAAAVAAAADGFIAALPHGYDTRVGEEGGSFSGGERQRIAIARAMLRDAPILLLDEPTSALDAGNEAVIREALARLTRGRTTIVIAHRLATIRGADLIVAMEAGRIAETGTHAELMARGGIYAGLYRLQFREGE